MLLLSLGGYFEVADDLIAKNLGGDQFEWRRVLGNDEDHDFIEHAILELDAFIFEVDADGITLTLHVD